MSAPTRQTVSDKAAEIIRRIYHYHCAGCCWHVVLDDCNWDCIDWVRNEWMPENSDSCITHGACKELADLDLTANILNRAKQKAMRPKEETEKVGE